MAVWNFTNLTSLVMYLSTLDGSTSIGIRLFLSVAGLKIQLQGIALGSSPVWLGILPVSWFCSKSDPYATQFHWRCCQPKDLTGSISSETNWFQSFPR
mmetsp:Transcript_31878/g.73241  ORF Transcript_31878/g.73241 Transcript_31878/m.73241 type:complete len:98 (+) Transcript_31878:374-667(+)